MNNLRILVAEDLERWQQLLKEILQGLDDHVQVDIASSYGAALQLMRNNTYDLATVDLSLLGDKDDPKEADQQGLDLLRELRNSRYHQDSCGLIVLTAYSTTARTRKAFRDYAVDNFFDKAEFDDIAFAAEARAAIRNARLRRAAARADSRYRLTITCSQEGLIGSELSGPDLRSSYIAERAHILNIPSFVRRTDDLNIFLLQDPDVVKQLDDRKVSEVWRHAARDIGAALYQEIEKEHRILGDLAAGRARAQHFSDLWIQFSSPALGLGLPFELLHDKEDYLGLAHILTRRLLRAGPAFSRKPEPFHVFIDQLVNKQQQQLRVLIVGANSDGAIPAAEHEATALDATIRADLGNLGIDHEVVTLVGADANVARVKEELRKGTYHIFHYAGHGRYSDKRPEISGLILADGDDLVTLSAADLNLLTADTELHMVYMSCCLGARNATQLGHNDFHGMLEALARADIPVVLGFRWTVADNPARELALHFYRTLWRTFSPGEALLEARRMATMGPRGRDDDTWMAPVLLMQNG